MNTVDAYLNALKSPFQVADVPDLSGLAKTGPKVLLFSPHPDDEVIVGALPLRIRRELKAHVINVAVTLGSDPERRDARRNELKRACAIVDFDLHELGYIGVTSDTRVQEPKDGRPTTWQIWCKEVVELIYLHKPNAIFLPHEHDGHPAHEGTYRLVMDALNAVENGLPRPHLFKTEFWHPNTYPNLMIESSKGDLALLLKALAEHRGEIERNPYHLRLPAWMMDNTRRGAERIQTYGAPAPDFAFSTLYHHILPDESSANPKLIGHNDAIDSLFKSSSN